MDNIVDIQYSIPKLPMKVNKNTIQAIYVGR